ncbi:MAG TPA: nuclear transport factor 2 family protein [Puia sp.]|nr:nuclear transport factor 2 family protein [Puia sp.]
MKKYLKYLLFVAVILTGCSSCYNKKSTVLTEEETIEVINRFDAGWRSKNMNTVDSVLSTSYIYFTQSGGIFSRDSVVATAGEPDYELQYMSRSEFSVEIADNTAIVSTRWKGKGSYRGTPFNEDQRCSIVVIKKGSKVLILSEHCTPIKPNRIFH